MDEYQDGRCLQTEAQFEDAKVPLCTPCNPCTYHRLFYVF